MDCGAFHRNLEDYLEGSLDYSGRLSMERHGDQCFLCGQELAQAQELHSMASSLRSVKASEGFEAAVLQKIKTRGTCGQSWSACRDWIYGLEWGSWRRLALASSSLALLALAALILAYRSSPDRQQLSNMESDARPSGSLSEAQFLPFISLPPVSGRTAMVETATAIESPTMIVSGPLDGDFSGGAGWRLESSDSEFVEYQIPGPDDRPTVVRLPKTIRMRYGQPSEEYFIRNVSH